MKSLFLKWMPLSILCCAVLSADPHPTAHAQPPAFGPKTCVRTTGSSSLYEFFFSVSDPGRGYVVEVLNGGLEDAIYDKVSSSTITLNGEPILGPQNFNQQVSSLLVPVNLAVENRLQVDVRGKPGGAIVLKVHPYVMIDSPETHEVTNVQPVSVTGHVTHPTESISVNSVPAEIREKTFSVENVSLREGSNSLIASAVTSGGFRGEDSVEIILDTQAPDINVLYPPEGFVTNGEVLLDFIVTDELDADPSITVSPQPPYVSEGAYKVVINAVDWAGNKSHETRLFALDQTAPLIENVSPRAGEDVETARPVILASYFDNLAGVEEESVAMVLDGRDITSSARISSESIVFTPLDDMSPGVHEVILELADKAGNSSNSRWNFIVPSLDTIPPQIMISFPPEGLATQQNVVPIYEVHDDRDPMPEITVSPQASYSAEGVFQMSVTAIDAAGNEAHASRSFTIDRTKPSVHVINPGEGGIVDTLSPEISIAYSDDRAGIDASTTTLSLDGVDVTSLAQVNVSGITYRPSADLEKGVHTVSAATSDLAGNAASVTWEFLVRGAGSAAMESPPEGSFGKRYENIVPPDATLEAYDPARFSIITGQALDRLSSAIPWVRVSIHGHDQYGSSWTDREGHYAIPVEGGSTFTIVFEAEGYLTAHRKVYARWNDIAVSERVVMIPVDEVATAVNFDGDPFAVTTHRSSFTASDRGRRSCSLVFTGDNRAFAVSRDGSEAELSQITVRATEYDSLEAMPAKLPPSSAFTYCVELSADDMDAVRFEKPVVVYVDNFLGFGVGEAVPAGYYDKTEATWVPTRDGVVVELLDLDADGRVDALDANGDDLPDDLDGDGIVTDEAAGLGDAARYGAGETFWRVEVTHFTAFDFNWPFVVDVVGSPVAPSVSLPVQEAEEPLGRRGASDGSGCEGADRTITNSYVDNRSRTYHDDIPVPGTGMALHYASSRMPGYQTVLNIPASGKTVPPDVMGIRVRMIVAGRVFEKRLEPLPDQTVRFAWDGRDFRGDLVNGTFRAQVSVGHIYDTIIRSAAALPGGSFGETGSEDTGIAGILQHVVSTDTDILVHRRMTRLHDDGWTISRHHEIVPSDPTAVYYGNGTWDVGKVTAVISTTVGSGQGFSGDGGQAHLAKLNQPEDVAVDAEGNVYIADSNNHRIRKVGRDGIINTVAGRSCSGSDCYGGYGGPATNAYLNRPVGIDVDDNGNLFIADSGNHLVLKVDEEGIMTIVGGDGTRQSGHSGDGGQAVQARLQSPVDVAVDSDGNVYIAENFYVRKVNPNGIISSIAGTGWCHHATDECYRGDGGLAVNAAAAPKALETDNKGNIFLATGDRVRKIDSSGYIGLVAGGGSIYDNATENRRDGQHATHVALKRPTSIAMDQEGNLYVSEYHGQSAGTTYITYSHKVMKVSPQRIISTFAGPKTAFTGGGFRGDGGPATEALLNTPVGAAVGPAGSVYIVDKGNSRIRKITPPGSFRYVSSAGNLFFTGGDGQGHIFSPEGRHLATIDLDSGVELHTFRYDVDGNLNQIVDRFGSITSIGNDGDGSLVSIASPDGQVTSLIRNERNLVEQIILPDGSYYSFSHDASGFPTEKMDPSGNRFAYQFDLDGRIIDSSDPEGGLWDFSMSIESDGISFHSVTSAEGVQTVYREEESGTGGAAIEKMLPTGAVSSRYRAGDGLSAALRTSCGSRVEYTYGMDSLYGFPYLAEGTLELPSGRSMSVVGGREYHDTDGDSINDRVIDTRTVNGKKWSIEDDIAGGVLVGSSPLGRTVTTIYDPLLLLSREVSVPGLFPVSLDYDGRGRLTSTTAGTRTLTLAYDDKGHPDYLVTPGNRIYDYTYDIMGRLRKEVRPGGAEIDYIYDPNGNLTALINPFGDTYSFAFSANNQRRNFSQPLSGSYSYSYDRDRRLTRVVAPSGYETVNVWKDGLLDHRITPEGDILFSYHCNGLPETVTRGNEQIVYGYDSSLITSDVRRGLVTQAVEVSYDNFFRPALVSYAGVSQALEYDDDGLLIEAEPFSVARNALNGLPADINDNNAAISRTFNGYGEIDGVTSTVGGNPVYSFSISARDAEGRIKEMVEIIGGQKVSWSYGYDVLGRLEEVRKDGSIVETYGYDLNGNRTVETNARRGISWRSFTYSEEDHVITAGPVSYQFDVDGFMTGKSTEEITENYLYSSQGELIEVTLSDGQKITYTYDPLGRRIAKHIDGVTREKYLWMGRTALLAVYDGSDNLLSRFIYADSRMPVAMSRGGAKYYLMYGQTGTLRAVSDEAGNIVKKIDYDSYGNIINDSNPSFEVPFGYAGGLHDKDTGLVHFAFRDYNSELGRWTAKDPIDFASGNLNLYGYVQGDPVNYYDSLGLYGFDVHYALTYQLARRAGFSYQEALTLARENQGVDEGFSSPFNFVGGGTLLHFKSRNYAHTACRQAVEQKDLTYLGKMLHVLQDSYSHEGYQWYPSLDMNNIEFQWGHVADGHAPDKYNTNTFRDVKMRKDTLRFLIMMEKTYY